MDQYSSDPIQANQQDTTTSTQKRTGRTVSTGRAPASQRTLTQTRRPARAATPNDEAEVSDNEEGDASFAGDDTTATGKKGLAKEVWPAITRLIQGFRSSCQEFRSIGIGM